MPRTNALTMALLDRIRAFVADTTDLSRGNIRVITEEPTDAQRTTWRVASVPMSMAITTYAMSGSALLTVLMAVAFSFAVGLAYWIATAALH